MLARYFLYRFGGQVCRPQPAPSPAFVAHAMLASLSVLASPGYTHGMKTAVSIPDDVFEKAERLARRMKQSRSDLFSQALAEYLARHTPDHVTNAMNQVCAEIGIELAPFRSAAARRTLESVEW